MPPLRDEPQEQAALLEKQQELSKVKAIELRATMKAAVQETRTID